MNNNLTDDVIEHLRRSPVFAELSSVELARLVSHITEKQYSNGELIYESGANANTFYLLLEGSVEIDAESKKNTGTTLIKEGFFGEEAAVGYPKYLYTTTAQGKETRLLTIAREPFSAILDQHPVSLKKQLLSSLHRFSDNNQAAGQQVGKDGQGRINKDKKALQQEYHILIGWLLSFFVPITLYFLPGLSNLNQDSRIFLSIFSVTILMWVFKLVPDYIAGLLTILVVLILGLTPSSVILSGFQSSSFFMAMSIFVLSGVVVSSGLAYRIMLIMLKYTPPSKFLYNLSMTLTGLLITPVIPSTNGRVSLTTPLLADMIYALGYKPKGTEATRLAIATFFGITLFSATFLTSKSINFVLFGMLPVQVQSGFQWVNWMLAASVAGIVSLGLFFIFLKIMFRSDEKPRCSQHHVKTQIKVLGKLSTLEWSAIAGVCLLIIGIVTTSIHKIQPAWIGMAIMFIFLALETMDKKAFRGKIDWPFLFLLGTLIGLAKAISYLEIDQVIAENLDTLTYLMTNNIYLFVPILAAIIFIIRIAVSINASVVIVASVFLPLAQSAGINPWIMGFMILTFSETFVLPYQCSYYLAFRDMNEELNLYNEKTFLSFNLLGYVVRIAGIYASIPLWRSLEILQ